MHITEFPYIAFLLTIASGRDTRAVTLCLAMLPPFLLRLFENKREKKRVNLNHRFLVPAIKSQGLR